MRAWLAMGCLAAWLLAGDLVGGAAVGLIGAGVAAEEPPLDRACAELHQTLVALAPLLRRGRVEVVACARLPGVRAVVVIGPAKGVSGDALELIGGGDRQRLRLIRESWKVEPLILVSEGKEADHMVRDALVPMVVERVVEYPALDVIDVVLADGELERPGRQMMLRLASEALGRPFRVHTLASLPLQRARAREQLLLRLPLTDVEVDGLLDAGAMSVGDVASMRPEAAASVFNNDDDRASELIERAAWLSELSGIGPRRRGW